MTVDGTVLNFAYDASGTPMALTYGGATYYYATNIQGDVTAILDSSGTAVVTYTYDAWGAPLSMSGTMASTLGAHNPLRYRGYVYDPETGLYYLQSRYYDPALGRFISADAFASTGQGVLGNNMFAYCLNNPANYVDYNGKEPITISVSVVILGLTVVVLVVELGAQAISSFLNWLSTQWYYSFARISFSSDDSSTDETLPQESPVPSTPELPDVTYPGDDPEKAPDGYEWQGKGKQGSKEGSYFKPKSGESLHPDLDHPEGKAPHWDYNYRGSGVKGWRIFSDGTIELKK